MPNPEEAAGRRAAAEVGDGMILGLGTGSTVDFALEELARRIRTEGLRVSGVATSIRTEQRANELGIPLVTLYDVSELELGIDGADEVDGQLRLVKGGGGALLREKVVASITRRQIVVVGADKRVERLADRFPLPIEVVPFALPVVARRLGELGGEPTQRVATTDNGNAILDTRFAGGLADPEAMERAIKLLPGVVEVGLFLGLCDLLIVGHDDGHVELRRLSGS